MLRRHTLFCSDQARAWERIIGNALKVALVVGTLLNLANHGHALIDGGDVTWGQLLLNYCIPFCVSAYSAARALRHNPAPTAEMEES